VFNVQSDLLSYCNVTCDITMIYKLSMLLLTLMHCFVCVALQAVRLEGIFASYWEDLCLMSREFSKLEAELSPGVSDKDPNGLAMLGRLRHFVQVLYYCISALRVQVHLASNAVFL
jgi:hypothetical protein